MTGDSGRAVWLDPAKLREAGLSWRKIGTLRDVVERLSDGRLDQAALSELPDDELLATLTAIPGIGPLAVQCAMLIALRREDVVLAGDLALRKAVQVSHLPTEQEVLTLAGKWRHDQDFFSVGKFVTTEPVTVIDLIHVPTVPSIFDQVLGGVQGQLRFLNELVDELRQPIDTARSNLDYVPTQVFCEYFLHVFDPEEDAEPEADTDAEPEVKTKVRGLVWTSAAAAGGGRCLALNVPQEDCVDVPTKARADYSCSWSQGASPGIGAVLMSSANSDHCAFVG